MTDRTAPLPWALAATAVALAVAAVGGALLVGLDRASALSSFLVTNVAIGLSVTPCGLLLARARPANPVGWLFLGLGVAPLVTAAAVPVAQYGRDAGWSTGAMRAVVTVFTLGWPWGVVLCLPLALQVFPTGRPASARWRPLVPLTVGSAAAFVLGTGPTPELGAATYLLPPGHQLLGAVAGPLTSVVLLASVASLVARYVQGDETTRRQLLWLLLAVLLVVGLNLPWSFTEPTGRAVLLILAFPLVPIAATIAVLRHGLFDVRLAVSRTVSYGLLTATVIAGYAGLVTLLDRVVRLAGAPVLATLAIALAFNPVRLRLQRVVDRAFYGARGDPVRAASAVGERLAGDDLAGVLDGLRGALQLPFAAVRSGDGELAASGAPPPVLRSVPLTYRGDAVGELIVGLRRGERALSPADRSVLAVVAAPLATALHATALSDELRASRERLVSAREEERRRLHRELHDSLGPVLTGAALKADAAANLAPADPAQAARLTAEVGDQVRAAIADVRRLVYGLRPPALDELGLVGSVRRQAALLGDLELRVDAPPLPELPAAVEVAAFRIAAEALTNVVRHSGARQAVVALSLTAPNALRITISDPGDVTGSWSPGVGLRSIQERVAELGGVCEAGPTAVGGRVTALLPLAGPS